MESRDSVEQHLRVHHAGWVAEMSYMAEFGVKEKKSDLLGSDLFHHVVILLLPLTSYLKKT